MHIERLPTLKSCHDALTHRWKRTIITMRRIRISSNIILHMPDLSKTSRSGSCEADLLISLPMYGTAGSWIAVMSDGTRSVQRRWLNDVSPFAPAFAAMISSEFTGLVTTVEATGLGAQTRSAIRQGSQEHTSGTLEVRQQ